MRLGDNKTIDIEEISTGSLGLDMALGIGAFQKIELLKFMVKKFWKNHPCSTSYCKCSKKMGFVHLLMQNTL